jgi:AraC-like DNA-binding protein
MKNFCQDIHIPLFVLQMPQKTLARFGASQQHWIEFLRARLNIELSESNLTDTLISLDDFCQVFRQTRTAIGKDRFLAAYVEDIRARHMGPIGLAMEAAPTIDDSLDLWVRNIGLLMPVARITPREDATQRTFELELTESLGDITQTWLELALLMSAAIIRNLAGGQVHAQIRIAHAADLPPEFYRDNFGFTPVFGQPRYALVFERAETAKVNDYYAPLMYQQALRGIEALRENIESQSRVSHRVRQFLVRAAEAATFPALEEVAEQFNMSVRTFTRRLQEEGSSFRDMRNQIQIETAKRLLRKSTLPIKAIVERAGFSNTAAFSRAFHLANGQTPMEYRKGTDNAKG